MPYTPLALMLFALAGCGVLYPGDSEIENPAPRKLVDPFRFSDLLEDTKERFAKLDREDLFHERFEYRGNDGQVFGRRPLFDRFDELENRYFRNGTGVYDTSLFVVWTKNERSGELLTFDKTDTITLYRDYAVTIRTEAPDSPPQDSVMRAHARFELVFHSFKNTWTIFEWDASHEAPGLTFFHPEYRD
ncbi:MAG: hypothetical protein GF363_11595 [Chitinivibrionales bacterium]|nr:hypothetical protein [Chitinivibrionales bacterium]